MPEPWTTDAVAARHLVREAVLAVPVPVADDEVLRCESARSEGEGGRGLPAEVVAEVDAPGAVSGGRVHAVAVPVAEDDDVRRAAEADGPLRAPRPDLPGEQQLARAHELEAVGACGVLGARGGDRPCRAERGEKERGEPSGAQRTQTSRSRGPGGHRGGIGRAWIRAGGGVANRHGGVLGSRGGRGSGPATARPWGRSSREREAGWSRSAGHRRRRPFRPVGRGRASEEKHHQKPSRNRRCAAKRAWCVVGGPGAPSAGPATGSSRADRTARSGPCSGRMCA